MNAQPSLDELLIAESGVDPKQEKTFLVVRLSTNTWHDRDGVYVKKTLRFQKRKSTGFNILYEDSVMAGADSVIKNITNLDECKDGLYYVVTCNEFASWETPHIIEDYDYKLIPLEEKST